MQIRPVHYRYLVKVFELNGWEHTGTRGDHLIYKKPGAIRAVVIPKYKTVPVFIIKNNLRTAGISRDEYLKLLKS
jgi:predicted RNA binding protein YcfA (HicA-like mRNA interferase family)